MPPSPHPQQQPARAGSGGRGHKAGVAVSKAGLPAQFTALDDKGEPVCVLDVEPPTFRTWRSADDLLVRCHVVCTLQISLGATNLVAFWATYWWTIAFSALCIVVGTVGSLRFRSLYSLRGTTCCCRSRSVVPAVLYGQLCISVMGALAVISAIISAVNAEKGSIEYGFAIMSAVVSFLLVVASGFGVFFIRRLAKRIKPTATVVVVAAPYGVAEGEGDGAATLNDAGEQPAAPQRPGTAHNGRRFAARGGSGAAAEGDDESAVDISAVAALDPPARRGERGARYAVPAEREQQYRQPDHQHRRRPLEQVESNHARDYNHGKRGGGQYAPVVSTNPIERAAFPPQEYQQQQQQQQANHREYQQQYGRGNGDAAAAAAAAEPRYEQQQRPVAPRARPAPEPQQQYRI